MAGFVLGAVVALFIGMKLGEMRVAAKGSRGDYRKAKEGLPGLRKKASATLARYMGTLIVIAMVIAALVYGLSATEDR